VRPIALSVVVIAQRVTQIPRVRQPPERVRQPGVGCTSPSMLAAGAPACDVVLIVGGPRSRQQPLRVATGGLAILVSAGDVVGN
jgi:hypothetical protein